MAMATKRKSAGEAADTRERILEAAASLFAERGYERTSMGAIARAVQVSAPALYYHFQSKEEILYTHLVLSMEQVMERAEATVAAAGTETGARIAALVRVHIATDQQRVSIQSMLNESLYGTGILANSLGAPQRATLDDLQRRYLDLWRGVLRDGIVWDGLDVPDVTAAAFAILGMLDHVVHWYRPGGRLDLDALVAIHVTLVRRMVGKG
ncbi:MAG: TetR/AcrR family transcriptional regulator [Alphaproteobacteria bacterium]|nr:TetR/AcrR family transcriptional regulator [Alphaproteobacteria bacterium]